MSVDPLLNYTVTAHDVLHTCPYNSSHRILGPRLSLHLMKCRKVYIKECDMLGKRVDIMICKWNSNHQMPSLLLDEHHRLCPDRESMAAHLSYHADPNWKLPGPDPTPSTFYSNQPAAEDFSNGAAAAEEDWDAELKIEDDRRAAAGINPRDYPGYNPMHKLQTGKYVYTPHGLTKSERKAHWAAQRLQLERTRQAEMDEAIKIEQFAVRALSRPASQVGDKNPLSVNTENTQEEDKKGLAAGPTQAKFEDPNPSDDNVAEEGDWWGYEM